MKVIICGAGRVGSSIATQLSLEDMDVTIIDNSEKALSRIGESAEVATICGHASDPDILYRAGAEDAEMIIAVTAVDEVNMIACEVANALFQVTRKIARIRNRSYLKEEWSDLYRKDHLPIDVIISPEVEVAKGIIRRLHAPGTIDSIPLIDGKLHLVELKITADAPYVGKKIKEIQNHELHHELSIIAIVHEGRFHLPSPEEKLSEDDLIYFLCTDENMQNAMSFFGHREKEARRVIIVGGGNIGLNLASSIENEAGLKVKLIEVNKERAEYVAEILQKTTVINGSALVREILQEVNIESSDTIIAVTNDDKVNILSSLLAKRYGCKRAVTLVDSVAYAPLVSTLGIDVVVSPRETTVSSILQHVRRGRIKGLHKLQDGLFEVLDIEIVDNSLAVGKSIEEIGLPKGMKIGAILRDEAVIIPDDDFVFKNGDRVVISSLSEKVKHAENIFCAGYDYF